MKSRIILHHIICYPSQLINIIFSNKLLNAPSEKKTTFMWNFCHLFPMLFYEWNTIINDRFRFFFSFFSRNHFLKGAFTFQLEGDFIFKCVFVGGGEAPHGGISFDGGRALKKVMKTSHAPHHVPHYRKPYIVSTGN